MNTRFAVCLVSCAALAAAAGARPVWKAPAPDAQSVVTKLGDGTELRVDVLAANLFRVRKSWTNLNGAAVWTESGLNRYGILKADWPKAPFTRNGNAVSTEAATVTVDPAAGTLRFQSRVSAADLTITPEKRRQGVFGRVRSREGRADLRVRRFGAREHHAPRPPFRFVDPQQPLQHPDPGRGEPQRVGHAPE